MTDTGISTQKRGPLAVIGMGTGELFNPGIDAADLDPFTTWPHPGEQHHVHPWHTAKENAERFEANQDKAVDQMLPRAVDFGDDVDDPGQLSKYHRHRIIEYQLATYIRKIVVPHAKRKLDWEASDQLYRMAIKMHNCRQSGPFGLGETGRVIVAWDEKCGCSKYCPDEATRESKRLRERYEQHITEHAANGGRIYKAWFTLPNYPGGRLNEGLRHIFKRFRDRMMRAQRKGKNKFGLRGALVILEAPMSRDGDWNIHLNVILLTDGWLGYKTVRDAWGANVELKQHSKFDDKGMTGLFNEMVKYSCRAIPEKSSDGHHDAPAMIEWEPDAFVEWFKAMRGFRRTRAYGSLHGVGKPDIDAALPSVWLGRIEHRPCGYEITRRQHDLALHTEMLLRSEHFALDLIRGDKSTTNQRYRGPP